MPESRRRGALNIPYAATPQGNVVAAASPAGQINAIEKTGGQAVAVTFTTDDGTPAPGLYLTTNLAGLPAGWSSASKSFSCSSVGTGNGCQLHLTYAPTALTRGSVTLNYAYGSGGTRTGSLNLEYAATTNDNVVGTASPTGQINAVVGVGRATRHRHLHHRRWPPRHGIAVDQQPGLAAGGLEQHAPPPLLAAASAAARDVNCR